jgi:hypothetical protein
VREQLHSGRLYRDGYVDARAAERALDDHVQGRRDMTVVLWPLMVLAHWFDSFGGLPPV